MGSELMIHGEARLTGVCKTFRCFEIAFLRRYLYSK